MAEVTFHEMGEDILISIVIPVKNGDYWLKQTLTAITKQTLFGRSEIIIIDSGSTDHTLEIIKQFPVRLIGIPPSAFNHGETRNLGAQAAKGKYVVMTVQDARPEDDRWLEKLMEGFDDDSVSGVCGQQVVPHDKEMNPVQWFRPVSPPQLVKYSYASPAVFNQLPPAEKKRASSWDDVNAMYRRDVLLKIPFRKMVFGEDAQWAVDALQAGYSIVYNNNARVYHYHYDNPAVSYKRMFAACYMQYRLTGFTYQKDKFISVLRSAKILLKEDIPFTGKIKWFIYNYRIRLAVNKAVTQFNKSVSQGGKDMEEQYAEICATSPVSIKPIDVP